MRLKIVQAATGEPLQQGREVTSVDGYAAFLKNELAPIHKRFADIHGYGYEYDVTSNVVHPFWMKAKMIGDAIAEGYERIVWLDTDAIWLGAPLDVEFPTVFGMTYQVSYCSYDSHFNAGVIFVNNTNNQAAVPVAEWFSQRVHTFHDQDVLNANHRHQITQLDHAWNSSAWIDFYRSQSPRIIAWHGAPNRLAKMRQYIEANKAG